MEDKSLVGEAQESFGMTAFIGFPDSYVFSREVGVVLKRKRILVGADPQHTVAAGAE